MNIANRVNRLNACSPNGMKIVSLKRNDNKMDELVSNNDKDRPTCLGDIGQTTLSKAWGQSLQIMSEGGHLWRHMRPDVFSSLIVCFLHAET